MSVMISNSDLVAAHMGVNLASIADFGDPGYRNLVWDVRQVLQKSANERRMATYLEKREKLSRTAERERSDA